MIHQHLTHGPSGGTKEVASIRGLVDHVTVHQSNHCLANQCRGLKRVPGPLLTHQGNGDPVNLVVDRPEQSILSPRTASPSFMDQFGQVLAVVFIHRLTLRTARRERKAHPPFPICHAKIRQTTLTFATRKSFTLSSWECSRLNARPY